MLNDSICRNAVLRYQTIILVLRVLRGGVAYIYIYQHLARQDQELLPETFEKLGQVAEEVKFGCRWIWGRGT